jgi:hypothetical protein
LPSKAGPGAREGAGKDSGQNAQEHNGRIRSRCNFPGFADHGERKNADDAERAKNRDNIRSGTPLVIAMYAIATSNAIGPGRNALTSATRRIPPIVTGAKRSCAGRTSITNAPSSAARISGKATRKTYQKPLTKERAVLLSACAQVSVAGNSMGQATGAVEVCSREDPQRREQEDQEEYAGQFDEGDGNRKLRERHGQHDDVQRGQANIVASTDSLLTPEA